MIVTKSFKKIKKFSSPIAVTLGIFDLVHLGHQKILQHLHEKKKKCNGSSYLITFEPHPQLVLKSRAKPIKILTTLEEKIKILQNTDLDYLLVLEFTQELSEMTGERFIEEILLDKIGMVDVTIGYDHAFGYRRSGNISTLKKYSEMQKQLKDTTIKVRDKVWQLEMRNDSMHNALNLSRIIRPVPVE